MFRSLVIVLFLAVTGGWTLDCTQIQDSQIFDGANLYIPGPTSDLQLIPPNFNCIYKIRAPTNATKGVYANVTLHNGLKGPNDWIHVTLVTTYERFYSSQNAGVYHFMVIPGAEISIQVVTKSVNMNSMFSVLVEYYANDIGPNRQMRHGSEMNFLDLSTLRDGKNFFNSITFVNTEPIYLTFASSPKTLCKECYIIDGTIQNQKAVWSYESKIGGPIATISNYVTILTSTNQFIGVVLNPRSERAQFDEFYSLAVPSDHVGFKSNLPSINHISVEVVNFNSTGIVLDNVELKGVNCTAQVVSGPPNNSSKLLLDLKTAKMPHTFDLQYFTIIVKNCVIEFSTNIVN